MKAYLASRTVPGHGARVFIPYEHHVGKRLLQNMKSKSLCGGADKDTGKCFGYEFNAQMFQEIQSYLRGYGFVLEECCETNDDEVWR